MNYSLADIEKALGAKYSPDATYVLETHRGAMGKANDGWEAVGTLPDSTNNDSGTMIIMQKSES